VLAGKGAEVTESPRRVEANGDAVAWPPLAGLDGFGFRYQNGVVSAREIDDYLDPLDEPGRSSLRSLRRTIAEILPEAEQGISYGMPAFRLHGKVVAGFAAFKNHLSYFPHSGSVLKELGDGVAGYSMSKGTLRFAVDATLPRDLVEKLLAVRIAQVLAR
jgi:uncharacterized protein YdhG (YjbR/CyaY superfamily)